MLAGIFHETDLLVAELLRTGILDDLGAADVAAIVSCVVYEHRSPDAPPNPWFSSKAVRGRWGQVRALSEDLAALERSRELPEHRPPDPTFAATAHAWVAGEVHDNQATNFAIWGTTLENMPGSDILVLRGFFDVAPFFISQADLNPTGMTVRIREHSNPGGPAERRGSWGLR